MYNTLYTSFSKYLFVFWTLLMSVHTFCTENGVLLGAIISRRERNGSVLFLDGQRVNASWQKRSSLRGGWSFTWINALAETTLLSADAVAHFVFLGIWTCIRRRNTCGLSDLDTRVHTRMGRRCGWIRDWTGNEKRRESGGRERGREESIQTLRQLNPLAVRASPFFLSFYTVYSPGFRHRKLKS